MPVKALCHSRIPILSECGREIDVEGGGGDGRGKPKDRAKPPEKWDDGVD